MKRFLLLFILLPFLSHGQDAYEHRYLGVGYRLSTFTVSELNMNYPVNRLMVTVDPIKYARIDLQTGYYSHLNPTSISLGSGYTKVDLDRKSMVFMAGLLGQYWFEKMSMYGGARYGVVNQSETDYTWNNFGTAVIVYENSEKAKVFAPVLGGEYRFSKYFSVGAELSFMFINSEYKSGYPGGGGGVGTVYPDKYKLTETAAFFRFYPF